jgi:hypothetical protein
VIRPKGAHALIVALVLCGCEALAPHGARVEAHEAGGHFLAKRSGLERVVGLVDACRPTRDGTGYNRVWADGSRADGVRCLSERGDLAALVAEMKQLGFVNVAYSSESEDGAGEIKSVDIAVYSAGVSVAGEAISFVYYPTPLAAPINLVLRKDGSVLNERRAVTPPPYHWFWERTS